MTVIVESPLLHSETMAHEWKQRYEDSYSPLGYGTSLQVKQVGEKFQVQGWRHESAD